MNESGVNKNSNRVDEKVRKIRVGEKQTKVRERMQKKIRKKEENR